MPNSMKQNGFLPPLPRLFTRATHDAYALIHFLEREENGDDFFPALTCPDFWSNETASLFASEAAYGKAPVQRKAIEENTVPSWLWRHEKIGNKAEAETDVQQIFDRFVGAATYAGWKKELFQDEVEARNFFDEIRYALALRWIAIDPTFLANKGVEWAYGHKVSTPATPATTSKPTLAITNDAIDAIVRGSADKTVRSQWHRAVHPRAQTQTTVRFANTTEDWEPATAHSVPVMFDLLAFRHNNGAINIEALCHATRLAVTLIDLSDNASSINLGFANLAPLLMAFALPYDSEAAHMTTAALSAIVTAEAYITSAQLAARRGMAPTFTDTRETTLRALRNHRRAAYGDINDYEKIAVLPQPLHIVAGLDLALVAAARRLWDDALELVRLNGLRHTQVTALNTAPTLALFMQSLTQGIDAVSSLTSIHSSEDETFTETPLACFTEGLTRLGYNHSQTRAIVAHATGHRNLVKAPMINHTTLRARGFDAAALTRIENYVPHVNTLRLAFTSWIVGREFCLTTLKIPAKKLDSVHFDLLSHLGFSDTDVAAANVYCYGHGSVKGAKDLRAAHAGIFVRRDEASPEVLLRMAAAAQGFISGDVAVTLALPHNAKAEKSEALILSAWRQGLKNVALSYVEPPETKTVARTPRRKPASSMLHTHKPALPTRKTKTKAGLRLVGLGTGRAKQGNMSRTRTR